MEGNNLNSNIKIKPLREKAGLDGKFQFILCFIFFSSSYLSGFAVTMMPLHKNNPDYICIPIDDNEIDYAKYENTERFTVIRNHECIQKLCSDTNPQSLFIGIIVDTDSYRNYITDLNVLCDDGFMITLTQSLFLGRIIGYIIFSFISDKYGRLPSLFIMLYVMLFGLLLSFFIRTRYSAFLAVLLSNSCQYLWNHTTIMSTEMMSEKWYSLLGGILTLAFSINGLTNTAIMFFFKDWNIILIYHLLLIVITLYFSHYYLVETPLYLLDKKKYDQLKTDLMFINSINNFHNKEKMISLNDELEELDRYVQFDKQNSINNNIELQKNFISRIISIVKAMFEPYLNLFTSKKNVIDLVLAIFYASTLIFIYYGQLIYVDMLPGNIYSNLVIIYITESIIEFFAGFIMLKFDKKKILLFGYFSSPLICLFIVFAENIFFLIFMVMILTCVNSVGFCVLYVYLSGIVKINIKSTLLSASSITGNALFMIVPYLLLIFKNIYLVFFSLSLLSGIFLLFS